MEWLIAIALVRFGRGVSSGTHELWMMLPGRARGWLRFAGFILFLIAWFGFREGK
jgi:hypothetical protein